VIATATLPKGVEVFDRIDGRAEQLLSYVTGSSFSIGSVPFWRVALRFRAILMRTRGRPHDDGRGTRHIDAVCRIWERCSGICRACWGYVAQAAGADIEQHTGRETASTAKQSSMPCN
jgi:hypothetical protein